MGRAGSRQHAVERMVVSLAEAAVLAGRIGDVVDGVVVDIGEGRATVQLTQPAVVADITDHTAAVGLGDEIRLRVVSADPPTRTVVLEPLA